MDKIHEFETGRFYDFPQVLKYIVIESNFDNDFDTYDHKVIMVDESRHLAYTLIIPFCDDEIPSGNDVLEAYDTTGRKYDDYLSNQDIKKYFGIDRL